MVKYLRDEGGARRCVPHGVVVDTDECGLCYIDAFKMAVQSELTEIAALDARKARRKMVQRIAQGDCGVQEYQQLYDEWLHESSRLLNLLGVST